MTHRKTWILLAAMAAIVAALVASMWSFQTTSATSATITWANWTSSSTGTSGSASGTLGTGTVSYSGQVYSTTQTTCGTDYWADNVTPNFQTDKPYISTTVHNRPPGCDIIALTGGGGHTITFSPPVVNPVMAVNSTGAAGDTAEYHFTTPFTILSSGKGWFTPGAGSSSLSNPSGNILRGNEGYGTLQFSGTFSSISWTVPDAEVWHGFTVGVSNNVQVLQTSLDAIEAKLDAQIHPPFPTHPTHPDVSNLDATVSSRATQTSVDAIEAQLDVRLDEKVSSRASQGVADNIAADVETLILDLGFHLYDQIPAIDAALLAIEGKLDAELDATVSSRATQTSVDAIEGKLDVLQTDVDLLTELVIVLFCDEASEDSGLSIQLCPDDDDSSDDGSSDD